MFRHFCRFCDCFWSYKSLYLPISFRVWSCVSCQAHGTWFIGLGVMVFFFPEMERSFNGRHRVRMQVGFTTWKEIFLGLV